ncbi:MAG: alpha/beta hydrolase [Acidimicrobiia bacterium]|nr:alpha/beta hydrolase [Acidimicrobiia bacterium]
MTVPTLDGVTARTMKTGGVTTRVLFTGPDDGIPVLFIQGNLSSATWWEETMVALPDRYRGIAPDLRGFGGADPAVKVDATRGMGDYVDDLVALLDDLGIDKAHIVGMSLGGNIAWHLMADHSERLLSVNLSGPGAPYGFCGTRDVEGTPIHDDFAGSGAGLSNPLLIEQLKAKNAGTDSPYTVRSALRLLVWKPPVIPEREDEFVAASFEMQVGEDSYPGDLVESPNWPFFAPGRWGSINALSPKHIRDPKAILEAPHKPSVLWVRGDGDFAVADGAASDPATLGAMGLKPDWPGPEQHPAQPMVGQTRHLLDKYVEAGGSFQEVVVADCGHVPSMTKPDEFNRAFHAHLESTNPGGEK